MLTLRRWRACVCLRSPVQVRLCVYVCTFICTGEPLCMCMCASIMVGPFSPHPLQSHPNACTHSPVADVPPMGMLPSMVRIVVAGHFNHFNNGDGARRQTTSTTKLK